MIYCVEFNRNTQVEGRKIMKSKPFIVFFILFAVFSLYKPVSAEANMDIYNISLKRIDGEEYKLSDYKGKVLLIVNVASKCGFTPQYKGLQKLYEKYRDRGFEILAFPSNDFLWQEPGTNKQISEFCKVNYGITFPLHEKISVSGKNIHPLYQFLTGKATNPGFSGGITWNFNKFLIGRDGTVVNRFGTRIPPEDKSIMEALESALGVPEVKKITETQTQASSGKDSAKPIQAEERVSIVVDTLEGKPLDVGKLSYETPVLLNFWAVWCPYCVTELPHISAFQENFSSQVKAVGIAINYRQSVAAVKKFVESRGLKYTLGYDTDGSLAKKYNVSGVPAFFLLKNGMATAIEGIPDSEALKKLLEK